MPTPVYDSGDLVRLNFSFVDLDGNPADPTVVAAGVINPKGEIVSYQMGFDAELSNPSTGNYYLDHQFTDSGRHSFRFDGRGSVVQSGQSDVYIRSNTTLDVLQLATESVVLAFPDAVEGQNYSYVPTHTGGQPTVWAIVSGTLPAWLSFDTATGLFSGLVPAFPAADIVGISVTAGNVLGVSPASNQDTLTVIEDIHAPVLSVFDIPDMDAGTAYSLDLETLNSSNAADTWTAVGALPVWATISGSILSGTVTEGSWGGYSVQATNSGGSDTSNVDSMNGIAVPVGIGELFATTELFNIVEIYT